MSDRDYTELYASLQKETTILTAQIRALYRELDKKFHLRGAQIPITFGFETDAKNTRNNVGDVNTGLGFGSVINGLAIKKMLEEYEPLLDGKHGVVMCPQLNTEALARLNLKRDGNYQKFSWGTVYPKEYFNPYESTTGRLKKTKNTVSIHWYMGSCLSIKQRMRSIISKPLHRIFGVNFMSFFKRGRK